MRFEEEYEDVLQNIESGIVNVYHANDALTDYEVTTAVEALIRDYTAEARGRPPTTRALTSLAKEVHESVKAMCEWRLGRIPLQTEEGETI